MHKKLSEFIKTASLKQKLFDPDYAKRRTNILAKRKANALTKNRTRSRRMGFPDTRKLFKSEDVTMFFKENLEDIIEHCGACESDNNARPKRNFTVKSKKEEEENVEEISLKQRARIDAIGRANQGQPPVKKVVPGSPAERKMILRKVREQWFRGRGSTSDKMDARSRLAGKPPPRGPNIATQVAQQQQAKQSAFDRTKANWQAQKRAQAGALPPDVLARKKARMAQTPPPLPPTKTEAELPQQVKNQRREVQRPGEEDSRLMQGKYPNVGKVSSSPLT